jgi:hypothetical protein
MTRLDAARRVIVRADNVVRTCGDVEIVSAWIALCEILLADENDEDRKKST